MEGLTSEDIISSSKNLKEFQTKVLKLFQDAVRSFQQNNTDKLGETLTILDDLQKRDCFSEAANKFYAHLKTICINEQVKEENSDYPLALVSQDLKTIKNSNAQLDINVLKEAFSILTIRGLENEIRFVTESQVIDPFVLDDQLKTVDSIRDLLPSDWNEQAKSVIEKFYKQTFEWEEEHLKALSHVDGKPWEFFTDEGEVFDNLNAICDRWSRYGAASEIAKLKADLIETLPKAAAPNFISLIGEHLQEILISLEKTEVNENTWKDLWQDLHAVKYSIEAMWRAKQFLNAEDNDKYANDMNTLQSYSSVIVTKKLLPLIKLSPEAKSKEAVTKIKSDWKDWLKEGGKLEGEINSFISTLK